jgi:predicted RNA-binding protein
MCELNAYIAKDSGEELYLENVNSAKSEEGKVFLRNLFGEQKVFDGVIREISLPGHRIVLEKK